MISAKDDEPQWVKDYYRKALRWGFSSIGIGVAIAVIGGNLTGMLGVFFLLGFMAPIPFYIWVSRASKPVNAWKKAWLKEHQIRTKEDSERS
jgi:hypothetical protein